jgi:hypothetical protein
MHLPIPTDEHPTHTTDMEVATLGSTDKDIVILGQGETPLLIDQAGDEIGHVIAEQHRCRIG